MSTTDQTAKGPAFDKIKELAKKQILEFIDDPQTKITKIINLAKLLSSLFAKAPAEPTFGASDPGLADLKAACDNCTPEEAACAISEALAEAEGGS